MVRRSAHREAGMTLLEVMLASAILATIVVLTWGSMSTSFQMRAVSLDKFDRYRNIQQAMERMTREISMAFVTNVGQQATNDQNEITYQTIFDGQDDELTFTALAHVRTRVGELASEQTELTYRLERLRGENGEMQQSLVRRSQAPIDDKPDEGGVKYVILPDVNRVTFEYWDASREIADDAWVRSWDAIGDHEGGLPARVRITIEVDHPTIPNRTLEFSTQTQIMLVDPLIVISADIAAERESAVQLIEEELRRQGFTDDSQLQGRDLDEFYNQRGGLR